VLYFPHPYTADEDGLLAMGGDLDPERLLLAYRFGIFPWYNKSPILWWFTHPRFVLLPSELRVAKSMRSYFNQDKFRVTYNQRFNEVIGQCKHTPRPDQMGTWINREIIASYQILHEQGYAHSVEVWEGDILVGGLYGLAIGKIFYGESMFSTVSNASKFGFISLVRVLEAKGIQLIDCQQETKHLKSMGAKMISKELFWNHLKMNLFCENERLILP
jgi:leucyl/phenylalanyl-tRNA--protein transferase